MKLKIKGTPYSRDLNNMAVLCSDKTIAMQYESELQKHKDNQFRDAEINKLKSELAEMKEMLQVLIRGQNG